MVLAVALGELDSRGQWQMDISSGEDSEMYGEDMERGGRAEGSWQNSEEVADWERIIGASAGTSESSKEDGNKGPGLEASEGSSLTSSALGIISGKAEKAMRGSETA